MGYSRMNFLLENIISILIENKNNVGISLSLDDDGIPDYNTLIWESEEYPKPSKKEFNSVVQKALGLEYKDNRRKEYPSIEDQLDILYHEGLDNWREIIKAVKDKYPKP